MTTLRILLGDDHEVFRAGLRALIQAQPDMEVVGEASNRQEAWQQVHNLLPDVVLLDVTMLDAESLQTPEHLASLFATARVLVLATHAEARQARQFLRAGAAGYLLRRMTADEPIRAIRTVAAAGTYLDPTIAASIVDVYLRPPLSSAAVPPGSLSTRESEVLRLLAWGHSHKEIAMHLGVSVKTVETYKRRLMEKLSLRSRVDLVRYAVRQGWFQEP